MEEPIASTFSMDGFPVAGPMEDKFSGTDASNKPITNATLEKTEKPDDRGMPTDTF